MSFRTVICLSLALWKGILTTKHLEVSSPKPFSSDSMEYRNLIILIQK